jgi:hypothetical protein
VSVTAASPSDAPRRVVGVAAVVAATIAAAAGGTALGSVLAGDDPAPPPAAEAQPRIGLKSGVARIPLPQGWKPLDRLSSLPGLDRATAVRGAHGQVALDIRQPEAASLLPATLAATQPAGLLPTPRPVRLGARTVWRYDLAGARPDLRVVALALPTTGGVVTIACGSTAAAAAAAAKDCEGAARSLQLDGASALAPAPETAAAILLPRTAALLNRSRKLERRRLAATRSPAARSAAAQRLAQAYAGAADRLLPVAAGDAARLTTALDALAQRHRVLAAASRERRAAAAGRAGAAISRQERRLGALLAAVTEPAGR